MNIPNLKKHKYSGLLQRFNFMDVVYTINFNEFEFEGYDSIPEEYTINYLLYGRKSITLDDFIERSHNLIYIDMKITKWISDKEYKFIKSYFCKLVEKFSSNNKNFVVNLKCYGSNMYIRVDNIVEDYMKLNIENVVDFYCEKTIRDNIVNENYEIMEDPVRKLETSINYENVTTEVEKVIKCFKKRLEKFIDV